MSSLSAAVLRLDICRLAAGPSCPCEHAIPSAAERFELFGREQVEEHRAHAVEMRGAGGAQLLAAGGSELRERATGVVVAGDALQQAPALEAGDESGQPPAAEEGRPGEGG